MEIKKFDKLNEDNKFDEKIKVKDFYIGLVELDEGEEYVLVAKTKHGDIVFGEGTHINDFNDD